MSVEELLSNWVPLVGEKSYERTNNMIEGEESYLIRIRMKLNMFGIPYIIEVEDSFQTTISRFTPEELNSQEINPEADEYRCNQVLQKLGKDFSVILDAILKIADDEALDRFNNL